jgi:carbon storage regulator
MLVLTRRDGQSVYVGESVVVTVVKVRGGKVRLAFDAPPGVRIDREEVHDRRRQWQAPLGTRDVLVEPCPPAEHTGVAKTQSAEPPAAVTFPSAL